MKPSFSPVMNFTGDVKYAAMHARVLTEDQGKGFPIPTQIDACQQLAAREGYTAPEGYVLIHVHPLSTCTPSAFRDTGPQQSHA
jgi:hypothetical protein